MAVEELTEIFRAFREMGDSDNLQKCLEYFMYETGIQYSKSRKFEYNKGHIEIVYTFENLEKSGEHALIANYIKEENKEEEFRISIYFNKTNGIAKQIMASKRKGPSSIPFTSKEIMESIRKAGYSTEDYNLLDYSVRRNRSEPIFTLGKKKNSSKRDDVEVNRNLEIFSEEYCELSKNNILNGEYIEKKDKEKRLKEVLLGLKNYRHEEPSKN